MNYLLGLLKREVTMKKVKIKKGYRFKGWDYKELAEAFCLKVADDDKNILRITNFLENINHPGDTPLIKANIKMVAKVLRRFLKVLVKQNHSYKTPVWEGLIAIKDDWTLLQMVVPLIPAMWD